jgi:hypothetical protein
LIGKASARPTLGLMVTPDGPSKVAGDDLPNGCPIPMDRQKGGTPPPRIDQGCWRRPCECGAAKELFVPQGGLHPCRKMSRPAMAASYSFTRFRVARRAALGATSALVRKPAMRWRICRSAPMAEPGINASTTK